MHSRLVALDSWRSTLLLFGLLVHATVLVRTMPGDTSSFSWIEETSRSSRMQAFFTIAGFLAARSIRKRERAVWLRSRMIQLLVPAVATSLTFSRMTDWVSTGNPFSNIILFGHIWFLYTLAAFSLLTYLLDGRSGQTRFKELMASVERTPTWLIIALFVGAVYAGKLARTAIFMASPALAEGAGAFRNLHVLANMPVMVVFYLFGHLIANCQIIQRLRAAPLAGLFAASLSAYIVLQEPNGYDVVDIPKVPRQIAMLLMYLMFSAAGTFLGLVVFAHANVTTSIPSAIMYLSRASYTIYLVHLFYLTALFHWWGPLIDNRVILLGALAAGGMALSVATHELFSRSRVLTFLFNGKSAPRSTPDPHIPLTSAA